MNLPPPNSDDGLFPPAGPGSAEAAEIRGLRRGRWLLAAVMALLATAPVSAAAHSAPDEPASQPLPERIKALRTEILRRTHVDSENPWTDQRIAQYFPNFPNSFPNFPNQFPNFMNNFPNWLNGG